METTNEFQEEVLTVKEFKKKFGITERMWKAENREEILSWISNFYRFEEVGHTTAKRFILKEKYFDYEPPEKKSAKEKKTEIYSKELVDEIQRNPYHIYKTLTCNLVITDEIKECNHKFGTSYRYVRDIMKTDSHFKKVGMVWCERKYHPVDGKHFRPLDEEELASFNEIKAQVYGDDKWNTQEEDLVAMYNNGELEYKEYMESLSQLSLDRYYEYINVFSKKHGFTPWKANIYEATAWEEK